jgi:hypothetical protein
MICLAYCQHHACGVIASSLVLEGIAPVTRPHLRDPGDADSIHDLLPSYSEHRVAGLTRPDSVLRRVEGAPAAPSAAVNLSAIEDTVRALLSKEGREADYLALREANLKPLTWAKLGRLYFVERFVVEYDTLCATVARTTLDGMWPIVVFDLTNSLESFPLCARIPEMVTRHPGGLTVGDLSRYEISQIRSTFDGAAAAATARISPGTIKKVKDALEQAATIFSLISDLITMIDKYERAKDAEREKAERDVQDARDMLRGAGPMEGAEDHVDAWEANRDVIERTC